MSGAVARLAAAIDYPEAVPDEATAFFFVVDGRPLRAVEEAGRLTLRAVVVASPEEEALERFAGYAVGRLLKESAVLAWDPEEEALILWQGIPATAVGGVLRRFFEVFATSLDWWVARMRDQDEFSTIPQMVIRP